MYIRTCSENMRNESVYVLRIRRMNLHIYWQYTKCTKKVGILSELKPSKSAAQMGSFGHTSWNKKYLMQVYLGLKLLNKTFLNGAFCLSSVLWRTGPFVHRMVLYRKICYKIEQFRVRRNVLRLVLIREAIRGEREFCSLVQYSTCQSSRFPAVMTCFLIVQRWESFLSQQMALSFYF